MLAGCATDMNGRVQAGMGIACGDLNGDQRLDLYVTNFFREHNTLYLNDGGGTFTDATYASGLYEPTLRLLGFGTQAIDVDLDGRLDLFVANGHIDDVGIAEEPWKMPPQLFQNLGAARFHEVSETSGDYFSERMLGRGAATCDWNRDGMPDLVVVHQDRATAILTNGTATAARSISCRLLGCRSNRDGLGAKLMASIAGEARFFEMTSGDGYCASNERVILIGLGTADSADAIDVVWPSGVRQRLTGVPAGTRITIVEGRSALLCSGD
jgi:hypothetical protein